MSVPVWALLPFVIMLLCIAIGPIVAEHWWENNKNKLIVSLILGVPMAAWLIYAGLGDDLKHQMLFDYIPFIILLGSLFVVTGGIKIGGDMAAKPGVNTAFIGVGYLLASIMGTTGAAMLLIRPVIEINKHRTHKTHTILFFIAAVANCGGLLTPLGDPPLFLLYLKGAPFTWFLNLVPEWAFVGVALLIIYYFVDKYYFGKEDKKEQILENKHTNKLSIAGNINFIYLIGIVAAVALINPGTIPQMNDATYESGHAPMYWKFLREGVLVAIMLLSLYTTKKETREANKFSWEPILEVAALFLGIFATMTPALIFLKEHADSLGLTESWHFYYSTGILSSFLDNAPTALAFHSVALGLTDMIAAADVLIAGVPEHLLKAISTAAVFWGAMTYIGNGPNFMVKAIAEQNKVEMPSFFGYMFKFSLIVLLPLYILTQLLFL